MEDKKQEEQYSPREYFEYIKGKKNRATDEEKFEKLRMAKKELFEPIENFFKQNNNYCQENNRGGIMGNIKLFKEMKRYCKVTLCIDCEISAMCDKACCNFDDDRVEEAIEYLEKWSKENPQVPPSYKAGRYTIHKLHMDETEEQEDNIEPGCLSCEYEHFNEQEEPCRSCSRNFLDKFKPREIKTRQSEYLKLFSDCLMEPNIIKNGALDICPDKIIVYGNCAGIDCDDCKKEFWSKKIEERR